MTNLFDVYMLKALLQDLPVVYVLVLEFSVKLNFLHSHGAFKHDMLVTNVRSGHSGQKCVSIKNSGIVVVSGENSPW